MADGKDTGWVYYDPTSGGNGPPAGGKQRPTRGGGGGGLVSRVSGHVRPRDPGGGTVPTVSPRRMTIDEVSHVMELSGGGGGGGPQLVPSRVSTVWTEETIAGDTLGRECPHDDVDVWMKFPAAHVLLADGPQLGSWQVAVVRVDETPAGDASGREYPHVEQNRQRPIDVSELNLLEMFVQWCRLGALPWLV